MVSWFRPDWLHGFMRFPLALASAFMLFALAAGELWNVVDRTALTVQWFAASVDIRVILGTVFWWFIAATLFAEARKWRPLAALALAISGAGAITYAIAASHAPPASAAFLSGGLFVGCFAAPYFLAPQQETSAWTFGWSVVLAILLATVVALLLWAGLSTVLVAIGYLFDFRIPGRYFGLSGCSQRQSLRRS